MSKIVGEITVKFDGEDRTFKVRRVPYSKQMRLFALMRQVGANEDGTVEVDGEKMEKLAAFQTELCQLSISDDEGKPAFTRDEVDEWGGENIRAVAGALDVMAGPRKTTVDHSGNS